MEKENTFYRSLIDNHPNSVGPISEDEIVCGLILAGGEGKRLQPFIKSLGKGTLPKQYVNFMGSRSLLEHAFDRAERFIPSERVLTVITESHLHYPEVRHQCRSRSDATVIIQPENKETGPGLLLPLMYLYRWYPNSVVLVLPSDHFIGEEDRLTEHAHQACVAAQRDPSRLIILGVQPDSDEPEYGYLVPDQKPHPMGTSFSELLWFVEKPERKMARRLIRAGGLWNTMIMAFRTATMLHWMRHLLPRLYLPFEEIYEAIGTPFEQEVIRKIYRTLSPLNFSKDFLEPLLKRYPSSLVVRSVRDLMWSDWGTASRILEIIERFGKASDQEDIRRRA